MRDTEAGGHFLGNTGVAVYQFLNFGTIDLLPDNSLWRVGLPCACLVFSSISACDPEMPVAPTQVVTTRIPPGHMSPGAEVGD